MDFKKKKVENPILNHQSCYLSFSSSRYSKNMTIDPTKIAQNSSQFKFLNSSRNHKISDA